MKNINSSQGSSLHCFYTNRSRYRHTRFSNSKTIRIFWRCTLHTCRGTLHAYTLHLNDMCFETTAGARTYPQTPPLRLLSIHIILHLHIYIYICKKLIYIYYMYIAGYSTTVWDEKHPVDPPAPCCQLSWRRLKREKCHANLWLYILGISNVSLSNDFIVKLQFVHFWS